jgi:hypothetical protein
MPQRTQSVARQSHKPKPPPETTHIERDPAIIDAMYRYFKTLIERRGPEDGTQAIANCIIAGAEWFDDHYGPEAAYSLVNDVAEAMILPLLEPPEPEEVDA